MTARPPVYINSMSQGLYSRAVGSSALAYREYHDDAEVHEEPFVSATGDSAESEARSLRKFHRAVGGKGWRRRRGWSAEDVDAHQFALNDYDGVTVGPGGRVDQIRLRDNNLSVTWEYTAPLALLNRWSLQQNSLRGLQLLTVLDLRNNSLRGPFPSVAGLLNLEELDISHNNFYGPMQEALYFEEVAGVPPYALMFNAVAYPIAHEEGMIPDMDDGCGGIALHQLLCLRRLRLNDNDLSGYIPKQIKHKGNLELLDCSNNDISDLLPAWACVGAVHADANDPYPREMYVFIMDAPPKLMEGVSGPARTAQARLRADEWIRWHLAQEHQPPHAMHLGEVQVEAVALPQHDKARVRVCIKSGGGGTHTIEFGKERMLPRAVFGAVNDATAVDEFPRVVVALSANAATAGQAADTATDSQASASLLRPCTTFSVRGNDIFQYTWSAVIQLNNCCNMVVKAPLALLGFVASWYPTLWLMFNLSALWLFIFPLIGLSVLLGLILPIDLLLARCGLRPAAAIWPFYRMLGFQGCKVPTLILTVELTGGGLEQV